MAEISTVKSMHIGVARSSLLIYFLINIFLKCRLPPAPHVACCGFFPDPLPNKKCTLAFHKQTYTLPVKGHLPIFSMNDPGEKRQKKKDNLCLANPLMKPLARFPLFSLSKAP